MSEHPLKDRLKAAGIRQVEAARLVGENVVSLNQWLLGYRPLPAIVAFRLGELIAKKEASHVEL